MRLKDFLGNTTKVVSKFPEMEEGVFFVNRLNKNQFQLATSPANISNQSFVSVSGIVTSNTLEYLDYHDKDVDHQLLLKEIKTQLMKMEILSLDQEIEQVFLLMVLRF